MVKSGLTVRKRQTSNIKQIAVYSPDSTFDRSFLANYTKINIEPRLSRIPGVGEVNVMGADYSMRIWLDPLKMARYGLTPSDITQVLNEQNVEVATGTLGAESQNTFQYVLKYRGRYEDEQGYAVGLKGTAGIVSALIMGGVVCTALSMAGDMVTDLKIGYWIGSTF